MTSGEVCVWMLDLLMLGYLIWQGEQLLKNDREKLDLEREQHRMTKERYEERAKWREQKRRQQERKTITESQASVGAIPLDGNGLEPDLSVSEGVMRDLSQTDAKT